VDPHFSKWLNLPLLGVPLQPKASMPLLKSTHGTQEVDLAESRPKHIRKIKLAICALPEEKP
jgi:hypothetical protein